MIDSLGIIFPIVLAMLFGLFSTRLTRLVGLPNVTGFIMAGVLIGPYVLGRLFPNVFITAADVTSMRILTEIALGFIAFSIGTSFKWENLKTVGKSVLVITVLEGFGALIVMMIAFSVIHIFVPSIPWPVIITLAAIATATDPAATLMVVRQYKARGPVVNTLLPVVALDDAVALISFAICFPIAESVANGAAVTFLAVIVLPLGEILLSLGIGALIGYLLSLSMRLFHSRANRLSLMIVAVLMGVGLAKVSFNIQGNDFSLSALLTCMMIGTVLVNARIDGVQILEGIDRWAPPLLLLFFVFSGASLDLDVFGSGFVILLITGGYVVFRVIGKFFGAFIGGKTTKADPTVQKYLGWMLVPQAGVAIGLSTLATSKFTSHPEYGAMILAVALAATLIYELTGPIITKIALIRAKAIDPENLKAHK